MLDYTVTGKRGALKVVKIIGGAAFVAQFPHTGYSVTVDGVDAICTVSNDGLEKMKRFIANTNAANAAKQAKTENTDAPERVIVAARSVAVGQKIGGFVVTGLGQSFPANADHYSLGVDCGVDYVQYAYFN